MIRDLYLKDNTGAVLGIAKVDIANGTSNIKQKQVSVNFIALIPPVGDLNAITAAKQLQDKIQTFIPLKNQLMSELIEILTDINVQAVLNTVALNTVV